MKLKPGTIVILVFDTDKDETEILDWNLVFLKKQSNIKKVICIPEVKNLEDELVRSCDITKVKDLMKSKSNSEYKHDLVQCKNLKQVLVNKRFNVDCFWT